MDWAKEPGQDEWSDWEIIVTVKSSTQDQRGKRWVKQKYKSIYFVGDSRSGNYELWDWSFHSPNQRNI